MSQPLHTLKHMLRCLETPLASFHTISYNLAIMTRRNLFTPATRAVPPQVQRQAAEREDINPNYNTLLRTHLLGWEGPPPMSPEKAAGGSASYGPAGSSGQVPGTPRSNKILRFKAGDATSPLAGPAPPSPFSASPIGTWHRLRLEPLRCAVGAISEPFHPVLGVRQGAVHAGAGFAPAMCTMNSNSCVPHDSANVFRDISKR